MDVLTFLGIGALILLQPLALILPFALWFRISEAAHYHHPYGSWRPGLATFAGVALGICQIVAQWEPNTLTFQAIFHEGGRWELGIDEFWTLVAQRLADGPHSLMDHLLTDDERWNYSLIVFIAAILFVLDFLRTLVDGFRGPALLGFLLDITMAVLACGLTIYGVHAGLWLLNRLNFWVVLVAILLLQEFRYGVFGLFKRKKRAAPTGSNGQHGFSGRTKGS